MSKLDNIRQKLQAQQNAMSGKGRKQGDNSVFPHWNIPTNTTTSLRFLPDGNEDNIFFWVERQLINLPFSGIKGTDHDKDVIVKVPCVDMFKPKSCPITQEIVPWFNTDMDSLARRYWKNRSYLFQGFVVSTDLEEDNPPENPIRRFIMSKSIFKIIQDSILDADNFDCIPTDYENGVNFKIKKTMKQSQNGTYADYSTSGWDRKESALTEEQLEAIDAHGLYDLSTFLPNRPDEDELEMIFDMFKASLDGQAYDHEAWGEHYAPWGLNKILEENGIDTPSSGASDTKNNSTDNKPSADTSGKGSVNTSNDDDDDDDDSDSDSGSSASDNANDILEQLKARAKNS